MCIKVYLTIPSARAVTYMNWPDWSRASITQYLWIGIQVIWHKHIKHYFFAHNGYEIVYSFINYYVGSGCIPIIHFSSIGLDHMPLITAQPYWRSQFPAPTTCILLYLKMRCGGLLYNYIFLWFNVKYE